MLIETVIIISLKRLKERFEESILECKKIGFLNIIIIDAIDGKEKNIDPHIACTLSHIKAWNYIKENNIKNYIIVEDDIKFVSKKIWNTIINNVKLDNIDYDFLLFGYFGLSDYDNNYPIIERILFNLPFVGNSLKRNNYKKINNNLFVPEASLGLHCYTINNSKIDKIINCFSNPFNLPDVMLNYFSNDNINNLKIVAIYPCLAYQNILKFSSTLADNSILTSLLNNINCGNVPLGWRLSCYGNKINGIPISGMTYFNVLISILIIYLIIILYTSIKSKSNKFI